MNLVCIPIDRTIILDGRALLFPPAASWLAEPLVAGVHALRWDGDYGTITRLPSMETERLSDSSVLAPLITAAEAEIARLDALPPEPTLDEIRLARRVAVNAERDRRIALGCPVDFGGALTFRVDTRNEADFRNINRLVTYAVTEQAAGRGAEASILFRDAANATHTLTPDQVVALGRAVSQRVAAIYVASWGIKDAVAGAPDQAALDALDISQGWPE